MKSVLGDKSSLSLRTAYFTISRQRYKTIGMGRESRHSIRHCWEEKDGSIYLAACGFNSDTMRFLIREGHEIDYPWDRYDGRTLLAKLCLNAVSRSSMPNAAELEETIKCLFTNGANIEMHCISADNIEEAIFLFALDLANPLALLTGLLTNCSKERTTICSCPKIPLTPIPLRSMSRRTFSEGLKNRNQRSLAFYPSTVSGTDFGRTIKGMSNPPTSLEGHTR